MLHDIFTRMWFVLVVGADCGAGACSRAGASCRRPSGCWCCGWRRGRRADPARRRQRAAVRLLHPGARRLDGDRARARPALLPAAVARIPATGALLALPVVLYAAYVVAGSARPARLPRRSPARTSDWRAALAVAVHRRRRMRPGRDSRARWPARRGRPRAASARRAARRAPARSSQFAQWAAGRTVQELRASLELGRLLPPGTLVQGKLANGLALENRIRPIFVGHGFGNYDGPEDARRCAIYTDLRCAEPRLRVQAGTPSFRTCSTPTRISASS